MFKGVIRIHGIDIYKWNDLYLFITPVLKYLIPVIAGFLERIYQKPTYLNQILKTLF